MYKVLLVDDEIFVRKGLLNLMDWQSLHYEICGEAENGSEALEQISLLQPDLVITDIRMPVLDGLGLIQKLTESMENPPVFIIISGYHDFKYAQQALRYGVHDYILKPIDEAELESTLRKLSGTLNVKRLASLTGEKQVSESVVETLIKGHLSEDDVKALARALQLDESESFVYVLAELHGRGANGQLPAQWTAKEAAVALQFLPEEHRSRIPVYEQQKGLFGLLLPIDRITEGSSCETIYRGLQRELSRAAKADVMLYIGDSVEGLGKVKQTYQSANEAMSYKFAEDGQNILFANRLQGTLLYYFDIENDTYKKLLEHVEENDQEAYASDIDRLFQEFIEKRFAPSAVANAITRCVIGIINIIREMDGDETELKLLPKVMDWQNGYNRLQHLKPLFLAFAAEAAAYMSERRGEQSKGGIERIKKYIEAHYTENISLKSIAAKFYMNSAYLGQLFRKSYGVYFNDYLLSIRIAEAKKLLRQTDLRMYEVAERVGFQNADYFVTQFEKLEKATPTDYRNKLLGKK
ncbi:response regulator [Paenibacillus sp. NEAU-GSW1]|uniref:response regulator n=1 Tax=Paenibacillus sp. NEAU-GSW1 TaxID=2682486 RepID=UPI0012E1049E|nr:response regulator [Paenibacillus sp. NEAU-GSW1]MUT67499.1 response regulator [Paenibacillus sp. NEAU-GSW1]